MLSFYADRHYILVNYIQQIHVLYASYFVNQCFLLYFLQLQFVCMCNLPLFRYHVVGRSRGLEDMGSVQIHLVVCLFLSWFFCVAAVIKGVQSLGKVRCRLCLMYQIVQRFYLSNHPVYQTKHLLLLCLWPSLVNSHGKYEKSRCLCDDLHLQPCRHISQLYSYKSDRWTNCIIGSAPEIVANNSPQ